MPSELVDAAVGLGKTKPGAGTARSAGLLQHRTACAPHPVRSTFLALTPSLVVPEALWASGVASLGLATVIAGVLLSLAAVHGGYAWFDAWRCRRLADRLLGTRPRAAAPSPLADWRTGQLTSERARRRLIKAGAGPEPRADRRGSRPLG
jgi:hypothetical protein